MDNRCSICRHVATVGRYLCEGCEYRAHTWLRSMPGQAALLQVHLAPAAGPAQRGGAGRAHSPLPLDLRALDLLGPGQPVPVDDPHGDQTGGIPITALLAGWAHYIAGDIPSVSRDRHGTVRIERHGHAAAWPRTGTGISAWSTWLTGYLPYVVTRPYAEVMYGQLEDLMTQIERITHTRERRTVKDAPCPACENFALVQREDAMHITCEDCGHRLTPEAYDAHRADVLPALARTAILMQAARMQRQRTDGDPAGVVSNLRSIA
ncbi:hypothetical protein ACFWZ0_02520 [[Kitasatospora] papulosa]|uniref:hypothetical protein n=1 Tax=[Kitasatospora] papulosa TaxID=1464011 RepID=UPI0036914F67